LKVNREQQYIADAFSNYFSPAAENISKYNTNNNTHNKEVPTFEYYLKQNNVDSPPSLVIRTFSTKEITCVEANTVQKQNTHEQ
jgi:hypothetical protein